MPADKMEFVCHGGPLHGTHVALTPDVTEWLASSPCLPVRCCGDAVRYLRDGNRLLFSRYRWRPQRSNKDA